MDHTVKENEKLEKDQELFWEQRKVWRSESHNRRHIWKHSRNNIGWIGNSKKGVCEDTEKKCWRCEEIVTTQPPIIIHNRKVWNIVLRCVSAIVLGTVEQLEARLYELGIQETMALQGYWGRCWRFVAQLSMIIIGKCRRWKSGMCFLLYLEFY